MIKINTVAIGNNEEAFIENRFKKGVNIIYSDDNNRGKTILMQAIMYTIGNVSVFPTKPKAFYPRNYLFYLELEIDGKIYYFLRKGNSICILQDNELIVCETIHDFTDYFDQSINKLPYFKKDRKDIINRASLELFYLCFFLGCDKKSTNSLPSSAINRYNKRDFENMLCGVQVDTKNLENSYKKIGENKQIILELKEQMKIIDKKRKKIKEFESLDNTYIPKCTKEEFYKYKNMIERLGNDLNDRIKEKKRLINKIYQKRGIINQINSIKQSVENGFLYCEDCNSYNIRYSASKRGMSFDITNKRTRDRILDNLYNDLDKLNSQLDSLDKIIMQKQVEYSNFINKNSNTFSSNDVLYFLDYIKDSTNFNEEYANILLKIDNLDKETEMIKKSIENENELIKKIKKELEYNLRNEYYKVDNEIEGELDGLFTKATESFSGSQAQFFLYSRIMAITKYFDLEWPIIIDSYRDGEVSSNKEKIIIKELKKVKNQVIITSTLKAQEYEANKYSQIKEVNPIDYSDVPEMTLLRSEYVEEFKKLVCKFDDTIE